MTAVTITQTRTAEVDGLRIRYADSGTAAGGPVIVLTSTRAASDYGGRITASPAAAFLPKDELSGAALRRFLPADPP